jgi:hypothetical protein
MLSMIKINAYESIFVCIKWSFTITTTYNSRYYSSVLQKSCQWTQSSIPLDSTNPVTDLEDIKTALYLEATTVHCDNVVGNAHLR